MANAARARGKMKKWDDMEYLSGKLVAMLEGTALDNNYGITMSQTAVRMINAGRVDELYTKVKQLIRDHLKLNHELLTSRFEQLILKEDGQQLEHGFEWMKAQCREWFMLSGNIEAVRLILIYSERVYENSVGGEPLNSFSWRIFREIFLEGSNICLNTMINGTPEVADARIQPITNHEENGENCVSTVLNGTGSDGTQRVHVAINRRPFISDDSLIDLFRCLDSANVGLSVALCSRRFAHIADYVLYQRAHRAFPLMLCDHSNNVFAMRLLDRESCFKDSLINRPGRRMNFVAEEWYFSEQQQQLELPRQEAPSWITNMTFVYLHDGITPSILSFLRLASPLLQNCWLRFEVNSLWPELYQTEQLWHFVELFNPLCFFLELTFDELYAHSFHRINPSFYNWPLWATLQGHFFPHCRALVLPLYLLTSRVLAMDFSDWLHHDSTATKPRQLMLKNTVQTRGLRCQGVDKLLELIKQNFSSAINEKHHFIVDLPTGYLDYRDERRLENGIGECLMITTCRIVRCAIGDEYKEFGQFYEQLADAHPKTKEKKTVPTVHIGSRSCPKVEVIMRGTN